MYTPPSDSRAIVDPTTFTMPIARAPRRCASRMAASVSAVSPDWEMTMHKVRSLMIGLRYRNSEAYSTSTGTRAHSSIMCSAMSAECQLVPHAVMTMLSKASRSSALMLRPPSFAVPSGEQAAAHRVLHALWLLEDLLQHEV